MKKIITILILIISFTTVAQIEDPIEWNTSVEKISDTEYILIATATIEKSWHLYSQNVPENGPIPTTFYFDETKNSFAKIGKTVEEEGHTVDDKVFEMKIKFFENTAVFKQKIKLKSEQKTILATVEFMVCDDTQCMAPTEVDLEFNLDNAKKASEIIFKSTENKEENNGLWMIFILGLGAGFIAIFTPCVFPLIPMTVSFFTKQSKNKTAGIKNAIIYGLSIIIIYVVLGTAVVAIFGASAINEFSTGVAFNLILFFILLIFAFSFLGAFEIMLPSSWANKIDSKADKGGYVGIFFMALALAIVSFSCTGPFVGNIIVLSASEGGLAPVIGMLGFSLAIALPFTLFAAFPGWLNSLPKSGGWLNTIKVVLGFLELALAFKFLSNADLVAHWDLLKREVFIGIWIVIFIGLTLYLFAKIKFPHDSPIKKLSFSRISFGVLVFSFVIYIAPGVLKNPTWNLGLLSGFPPPQFYSIYEQESDCPLGLDCYKYFDEGLAKAKEVNKPILLDFTGWACVNCRKMEENVWSEPDIYQTLKNDYILISLYVDDNEKELPIEQQFDFLKPNGKIKKIKTVGDKWSTFQVINFKNASQPYYVLLSPDLEILNNAQQYTDRDTYYNWLKEGLDSFNQK